MREVVRGQEVAVVRVVRRAVKGNRGQYGEFDDVMAVHEIAAKVCFIQCFNECISPGCTCQRTLEFASRRGVILVYLQYDVYDSPSPSTFVRSGPNGQAPVPLPSWETVRKYRLEECLTIVLKSEIGDGQTGKVLRGMLMVEASACVSLDIALKLALGSERGNALRNEYRMYRILEKSGVTAGITTPLGLFDDVQGDACALVMPYMGSALADMPEFVLTSPYQCSAILYHYPHFLTLLAQGNHSCNIEGNTQGRHTPRRSSFGQCTCGGFGSHNHRLQSIASVL
jgi:hypothetical protein